MFHLEDQTTLGPPDNDDNRETRVDVPPRPTEPAAEQARETPNGGSQPTTPRSENLDRFRLEHILGQGGMGQVWEAWDPVLQRQVAIKRLHTSDWSARRRFLREARLQASIAHPGICPVFEVGEHAEEPFIVMPRLDGDRLDKALVGAPLEYKLDLLRQVAEAVHFAHQHGLIHRDLKPSNILLEHPPDSPPRPVVIDFGIARPLAGDGPLTAPGEIVGTPAYMAPEQIEGNAEQLDRRADVYALGATLYRLLAGRPPHAGAGTPLLLSVVHDEPERLPPRDVPREVEAIVFTCLEKEKTARYDSARALAEDLERFLAGEPVLARPVTRRVRFSKWLRRNRAIVRVGGAAALVAILALAWGGWSVWRSDLRRDAARQFGAQVEEIEALARYSQLLPPHDMRGDRMKLRARLGAIRPSLDDKDPIVRALASHAIGRGHLALDEPELARGYLEAAYRLAPGNAEIAADLGRTLSELYRERLTTLERILDRKAIASVQAELSHQLESRFLEAGEQQRQWLRSLAKPALDLVTSGRAAHPPEAIELEALILFHRGDPEAALERIASAPAAPAWVYERHRLEGDIRRSWAAALVAGGDVASEPSDGENPIEALPNAESSDVMARRQLEAARRAYGRALRIAPSHAAILRSDAQTIVLLLRMGLVAIGDRQPLIDEAREILHKARIVAPERLETWLWAARLELIAADHFFNTALDPEPALTDAYSAARRAKEIDERSSAVWLELAQVHGMLARLRSLQGREASDHLEQAAAALGQVASEDRDYSYFVHSGVLHMIVAAHRSERGEDATPIYQVAIDSYRKAAQLHTEAFSALTNLGAALYQAARVEGADSETLSLEAIATFEQAHQMRPKRFEPFYFMGLSRLHLAQGSEVLRTSLDSELAEHAERDFMSAIERASERFEPWVSLGKLSHLRAIDADSQGLDSTFLFAQARQAHGRALSLAPDHPTALLNLAWTAYFEAKFALRAGLDPSSGLSEAEELCQRATDRRHSPKSLLCLGSTRRMQAEYSLNRGAIETAPSHIAAAEEAYNKILAIDAQHAEAHRSLGRLFTLEARRRRAAGADPSPALELARNFLDRALELKPSLVEFHLADAYWCLEKANWLRAEGHNTDDLVAAGRDRLSKVRRSSSRDSKELVRLRTEFESFHLPKLSS